MVQIFLAHASEDKETVIGLYERLKQQGYKPWLDKKDLLAGQRWEDEIQKAISDSEIFLACLSQNSVQKRGYVQSEFRMALKKCGNIPLDQIYLIPVRLDNCVIPQLRESEYGINLSDYQAVNLFETDGFDQLIKSIKYHFPEFSPKHSLTTEEPSFRVSKSFAQWYKGIQPLIKPSQAIVESPISAHKRGRIRFQGTLWQALPANENEHFLPGESVRVVGRVGISLRIAKFISIMPVA